MWRHALAGAIRTISTGSQCLLSDDRHPLIDSRQARLDANSCCRGCLFVFTRTTDEVSRRVRRSPVNPVTNVFPLVVVLTVSLIKEGAEDNKRRKKDAEVLMRYCINRESSLHDADGGMTYAAC